MAEILTDTRDSSMGFPLKTVQKLDSLCIHGYGTTSIERYKIGDIVVIGRAKSRDTIIVGAMALLPDW